MNERDDLIRHLREETGVLQSAHLIKAFEAVDRGDFVPEDYRCEAYEDYPLPIGFGQTISQPTTVAFMLEKLDVREGDTVLDVGSGSGWTTALLAHLVGAKGSVVGVESIPELVEQGRQNLRQCYSNVLKNIRITLPKIKQAKKEVVGLSEEAPFDKILVSAAAQEIPDELVEQLKPGGVLVIPVGGEAAVDFGAWQTAPSYTQSLMVIRKKKDGSIQSEEFPGFAFVPLR